jgi:hypothetical protein
MDLESRRSPTAGCLWVFGAVFACLALSVFVADRVCIGALNFRAPVYPESRVVNQTWNFLSPNGMGNTVTVLYTLARPEEVQTWYYKKVGENSVLATRNRDLEIAYRITNFAWSADIADDGRGTQVILIASCLASR